MGIVDIERAMQAMASVATDGTIEEAIMDVTVWWPVFEWYGLDVTVICAGATRMSEHTTFVGRQLLEEKRKRQCTTDETFSHSPSRLWGAWGPAAKLPCSA